MPPISDTREPADERQTAIDVFLADLGWGAATRLPLPGDASTRRYIRLALEGRTAMLMDAPARAEAPICPLGADPAARAALGYNALARLAGSNLGAFAGLAGALVARGHSAPRVLGADRTAGLLLLEDLGDDLYSRALDAGADPHVLYGAAIDVLASLRRSSLPEQLQSPAGPWTLLGYDQLALQAEADLFLDWCATRRYGRTVDPAARTDWAAAWAVAFATLAGEAPTLVLRDVHADNLMWLPDRAGSGRAGLLDFQDALLGHPAYDVVSLLQDARRDVPEALAEAMIERYVEAACLENPAGFGAAYAVLGAQRGFKILGIFVRLDVRDGKPQYLRHLPRVARHVVDDLTHPALADVARWVRATVPELWSEAGR